VSGRQFVPDAEVEITAGQTTRVTLAARPGREVRVDFAMVDPDAGWGTIGLEIRDATGALCCKRGPAPRELFPDHERRFHDLKLPIGAFELEAWTDTGLRASARLVVGAEDRPQPEVRLLLQ